MSLNHTAFTVGVGCDDLRTIQGLLLNSYIVYGFDARGPCLNEGSVNIPCCGGVWEEQS